jgi:hypothetical protein
MAFQQVINITQALAVEGQFASANPRHALPSVEGGWRAGSGGVQIGMFCWVDATNTLVSSTGAGLPSGFVANVLEGLNMAYFGTPGAAGLFIPPGFGVGNIFNGGDFWVKNRGAGAVVVGMKAFAGNQNSSGIQFAAAGTVIANWTETKFVAGTAGAPNELVKMQSTPFG